MPAHLRPTAPIARDVVLPGDPKRAMELATALMAKPVMSNLSRGLWGYYGTVHDGRELTVQSTGIGGPSGAVVLAELAELGVRRAIRLGTCVALDPALGPGDVIVADAALPGDGVGSSLRAGVRDLAPDAGLSAALQAVLEPSRAGLVASTDLYYDHDPGRREGWRRAGAIAVDLSAAALLAVGRARGIAVACALVVAESAAGGRLGDDELDGAVLAAGRRAAAAFERAAQPESASPVS
jgi:uridine phosphorylase